MLAGRELLRLRAARARGAVEWQMEAWRTPQRVSRRIAAVAVAAPEISVDWWPQLNVFLVELGVAEADMVKRQASNCGECQPASLFSRLMQHHLMV